MTKWKQYPRKATTTSIEAGVALGFRSGLEDLNAQVLIDAGVNVEYEEYKLKYSQPEKLRTYTPDFILPNGIIIETKGRFITSDRQKHLHIKSCWKHLEVRFVFSNANTKISKKSKTSYANWCEHKGFIWAHQTIPARWLKEKPRTLWLKAANDALDWNPPT